MHCLAEHESPTERHNLHEHFRQVDFLWCFNYGHNAAFGFNDIGILIPVYVSLVGIEDVVEFLDIQSIQLRFQRVTMVDHKVRSQLTHGFLTLWTRCGRHNCETCHFCELDDVRPSTSRTWKYKYCFACVRRHVIWINLQLFKKSFPSCNGD